MASEKLNRNALIGGYILTDFCASIILINLLGCKLVFLLYFSAWKGTLFQRSLKMNVIMTSIFVLHSILM